MKDFLKFTFATITGIIVSVVVLVFISILVVFSMVSSSESETQVRKNSIMMLDLNGALAERSQDNPFDALMGDNYKTYGCLLYTSPSPRDRQKSRMPSSA